MRRDQRDGATSARPREQSRHGAPARSRRARPAGRAAAGGRGGTRRGDRPRRGVPATTRWTRSRPDHVVARRHALRLAASSPTCRVAPGRSTTTCTCCSTPRRRGSCRGNGTDDPTLPARLLVKQVRVESDHLVSPDRGNRRRDDATTPPCVASPLRRDVFRCILAAWAAPAARCQESSMRTRLRAAYSTLGITNDTCRGDHWWRSRT